MAARATPYKAIADHTRRRILDLLRGESLTAGAIAATIAGPARRLSRPAVSKHLSILRRSRLVTIRRHGRERIYSLNPEPLREVGEWVQRYEEFWDQQLQSFKDYVEAEDRKEKRRAGTHG
jgi:DNA-binding transcriptional ArsR family regulator